MTSANPLRVLHVGVSGRGHWPLTLCTPDAGFAPTTLCDVQPAALAKARELVDVPESACFTDLDAAIARGGVDCAIVCTPTVFHVPLVLRLIEAGLPVLVEKGMAPDWTSAQKLVAAVRGRNAKVVVAQDYRYDPLERTIHRALHDPSYAAHVGVTHFVSYSQPRNRPVPRTLNYPFACVWDMSCHHFDNMLYWLGPIAQITAFAWRAPWSAYEHESNTAAHIEFQSGTRVHYFHGHDAARMSVHIELHGQRGALVCRDGTIDFNNMPEGNFASTPVVPITPEPGGGEKDLLADFRRYVRDDVEPGTSAGRNLEVMAACEMTVRSIQQGRPIRREELDP